MNDVVRQRIKYLVEHGELYPTDEQRENRKIWIMLGALALLQVFDTVLLVMR